MAEEDKVWPSPVAGQMPPPADADGWNLRADGERFWGLVEEGPLVVRSNQTAYRVCRDGGLGLLVLIAVAVWHPAPVVVAAVVALVLIATGFSWRYYWTRERPLNPLMAVHDAEEIRIGCALDCLVIPWASMDPSAEHLPVNNDFMAIPVGREGLDAVMLDSEGGPRPWDRKPYRRTILTVRYNEAMSWVEVHANPNGFFVSTLGVVYPMICIWRERHNEQRRSGGEPS
jgi:hypothetical protein